MKTHKVFTVTSVPFNVDLLSGQLWNLDIEGLSETNNSLLVYADQNSSIKTDLIESELRKLVRENILESFTIDEGEIEEINWNEEWEKKIQPIQVTDKIIITPSFHKIEDAPDKMIIIIDPKMSFGTGEHETTKLVLQLLEEIYSNHKKVLDIGSGTAVLAIATAKMGAEKVIAVDNDEWCSENGTENVGANNVDDKVQVLMGEISSVSDNNFDLILANINRNILVEIADDINKRLAKKGDLILSGLLDVDENDIKKTYTKKGFRFIQLKRMNEWIALHFKK
jgi:ribosomal protein L11 methyltransferase